MGPKFWHQSPTVGWLLLRTASEAKPPRLPDAGRVLPGLRIAKR
jgi:hypothetical protein